jgi:sugar-specific transcriptional regulator TrmB
MTSASPSQLAKKTHQEIISTLDPAFATFNKTMEQLAKEEKSTVTEQLLDKYALILDNARTVLSKAQRAGMVAITNDEIRKENIPERGEGNYPEFGG